MGLPTQKLADTTGAFQSAYANTQNAIAKKDEINALREERENSRADRNTQQATLAREEQERVALNAIDFSLPMEQQMETVNKLPAAVKIKLSEFYGKTPADKRARIQGIKELSKKFIINAYPTVKDEASYKLMRDNVPGYFKSAGATSEEIAGIMAAIPEKYDPARIEFDYSVAGGKKNALEPFTLSAGQARYDGEGNVLASVAPQPKNEGFTLGQGQKRFDDKGNVLAAVDPRQDGSGSTNALNNMKVEAWKRIYSNKASDADLSLVGLDRDPALAQAAKMANDDLKMINATVQEKAARTIQLAETLRGSSGGRYQSNSDPLGIR